MYIVLGSLPCHPSLCWCHSTYPGSKCQPFVAINLMNKCPLSVRTRQLFVLAINCFAVWIDLIPVTCFRCYLCWASFVAILHSFIFSKCCLHEIFHPQFYVHVLLLHSLLIPPPNPHILLQHLCFVRTGALNLFYLPTFFVFNFLLGLSNFPDIFHYQLEPSCSVFPTCLLPLNCILVLSTFLDGQTLVAVSPLTLLKIFKYSISHFISFLAFHSLLLKILYPLLGLGEKYTWMKRSVI